MNLGWRVAFYDRWYGCLTRLLCEGLLNYDKVEYFVCHRKIGSGVRTKYSYIPPAVGGGIAKAPNQAGWSVFGESRSTRD